MEDTVEKLVALGVALLVCVVCWVHMWLNNALSRCFMAPAILLLPLAIIWLDDLLGSISGLAMLPATNLPRRQVGNTLPKKEVRVAALERAVACASRWSPIKLPVVAEHPDFLELRSLQTLVPTSRRMRVASRLRLIASRHNTAIMMWAAQVGEYFSNLGVINSPPFFANSRKYVNRARASKNQ